MSASTDGALLAAVLDKFGVEQARGSSSRRGPQALLELTTRGEMGYDLAVTSDGPRGPRYIAHAGVISLAQITGFPIIGVTCNTRRKLPQKLGRFSTADSLFPLWTDIEPPNSRPARSLRRQTRGTAPGIGRQFERSFLGLIYCPPRTFRMVALV